MDTLGSRITWGQMLNLVNASATSLGEKSNTVETNPKYIVMEKSRYEYVVLCGSIGGSYYFPYAECDSLIAAQKVAAALNAAETKENDEQLP